MFDAITDRHNAEEFARKVKVAIEQYNDPLEGCKLGKTYDDFLVGGDELSCTVVGESTDHFSIKPFRNLYIAHANYDMADMYQPNNSDIIVPETILELFYNDGTLGMRMKDKKMSVTELYDESLRS